MILFTMAGDGTRFRKEGFTQKSELMLQDKTLLNIRFSHSETF